MFAMLVVMGAQLGAQTIVTGEIAGSVTDPSGAAIPKVVVSAKSEANGDTRAATTNDAGEYHISLLPPGVYTLSATASGFQPVQVKATASLGQIATANIKLSLQEVTTIVDVTTAAPLLQSENANVATTLGIQQLENIPVGGSDLLAYVNSTPGVVTNTVGPYGGFSSFGLPASSNMFTFNGTDIMDPYLNQNNSGASNLTLGANEVQETAIVTNGYTGQYGRQAGAQVNYVSKSGTNTFHGNALWNWNGTKLNANDWFNNSTAPVTVRPHSVSNQWGASFGGPIKKDKLFFFVDQEGLRYVLPSGGPIYIPTTDFASYVLKNVNPAALPIYTTALKLYAGASGAARALPVTAADDPALGCGDFKGGGFGTTAPCARKFQSAVNSLNTEWLLAERVDFNATDNDRLYFRAWTDRGVQATGTDAINPAFSANSVQPQWTTQLGYTRVVSPRAVNQLLLSVSYYSALFGPPDLKAALATFPTTFRFDLGPGLFSSMGGGATPAGPASDGLLNFPNGRKVSQYQIVDDFAYTRGKHDFKVGVNVKRNDVGDYAYGPDTSGEVDFNSIIDFVNGTLENGSVYLQNFTRIGAEHIGLYDVGFYGQDQWKVNKNLTVTAALRFDRFGNPTCGRDCFSRFQGTFEELTHDATLPYNSAIHTGLHNAFRSLDAIDVQPRLGIAYTMNSKTVIRAGVGLFADNLQGALIGRFFTNAPNVASFSTTSGTIAPGVAGSAFANVAASNAAFQQGFSGGATLADLKKAVPGFGPPNFYTVADQLHVPRYAEWNFEVQQQLTQRFLLSVNYVGNHGWDGVNQSPFPNAYSPANAKTGFPGGFGGLPTTAPDARFGEINELSSRGHSYYNGLTSTVKWRFQSVTGLLSYTWSHVRDTCSNNCREPFSLQTITSMRYQFNPAGPDAGNYGNADYDIRHSLTANYVWAIPTHFRNGALKQTLGGWNVGGIFIAHTGFPFTVVNSTLRGTYTKNTSGIATLSIPADWVGGTASTSCTTPNVSCFPKSEFLSTAQQKDFGNLSRNFFRGPGYFDTDLNVNKSITLRERAHFVIGATFFNVLNHPNFDQPVNNLAAGNFGQINATVSPFSSAYGNFTGAKVAGRVIVLNAKFQF